MTAKRRRAKRDRASWRDDGSRMASGNPGVLSDRPAGVFGSLPQPGDVIGPRLAGGPLRVVDRHGGRLLTVDERGDRFVVCAHRLVLEDWR